jgi:hypothetical protein
LSPYYVDVTSDLKPDDVPFQAWAREEYQRRRQRSSMDDPAVRCKPYGVPAINAYPAPFKILHTDRLMAILYEVNTTFRQIFVDGRNLPSDPQPTWMGYSVGHWDGDTLVVRTMGFNDRGWLDRFGHPYTEALTVTERHFSIALSLPSQPPSDGLTNMPLASLAHPMPPCGGEGRSHNARFCQPGGRSSGLSSALAMQRMRATDPALRSVSSLQRGLPR